MTNTQLKEVSQSSRVLNAVATLGVIFASAAASGCSTDDGSASAGAFEHLYATASITWTDESSITYVSLLPNLEKEKLNLKDGIEYAGWAGISSNDGKLFITNGEAPTMTRYGVGGDGRLNEEGAISFLAYGAEFAGSAFLSPDEAYLFTDRGVVWDPSALEVTRTFELPQVEDRAGGLEYGGLSTGRSFVTHGNRAYVATNWANWDTYELAEDSLIVVIDTENHRVVNTISAPCPYLDVATVDDEGYTYFSNWTYTVSQTLVQGKKGSCAVRIAPGADELDDGWSLNFADVTGGREGGVLRYLGENKALFVAYHHERITGDVADYAEEHPGELADLANWKLWMLDLETLEANPVEGLDWSAGGYNMSRVGSSSYIMAPSEDYSSTSFYEVLTDGTAKLRFVGEGWSLNLVQVR